MKFAFPQSELRLNESINYLNDLPCGSAGNALAAAASSAYRSCFNDYCAETFFCPQQAAFVGDRGTFASGHFRTARSRRRIRRAQSSNRKKARVAARPDTDQSLL